MGIVTPEAVLKARGLLNTIGDCVANKDWDSNKMQDAANNYMMAVPQHVGHKFVIQHVFPDSAALQRQNGILDALDASILSLQTQPKTKKKTTKKAEPEKAIFSVKLELIEDDKVIDRMRKLYRRTRKDMHVCKHLDIKRVFSVSIEVAEAAFEKDGKKVGNLVEAWHGTNHANILSILKGGMVVPPSGSAHVTGRMFNDGVYGAIDSTKSLNYAYGYWDGSRNERCFMFRMDMAMGKYFVPTGWGARRPSGYDSIWAKASKSGVRNDELIVPRASQVSLKWLMEFTPNGR